MINKIKNIANTEDKKRLLSNFFSLSILQTFTYILPLLTLPYLVKVLGIEKFGLVMFAQAFIMFFGILVDFGFNLSATREVSIYRDNKEKITEIFSSIMIIKFILLGISFVILSIIVFSFEQFSGNKELYFITFLLVIGQAFFPIWYFQGLEQMKYITIVNIISKVLFTISIFIVIQSENDYLLVPLLNGLGFIVATVLSLWMVHKNFNQQFELQSFKTILVYFKDSSQFFLSRVSVGIYTSANTFVLGLFTDSTMVGYYAIAEKLYMAIQWSYTPITQALYPYVAKHKNITLFKKIFTLTVMINTLGIITLFFSGQYIFELLFTSEIGRESLKVFHIFLLAIFIVVPSILLGYPFLAALGFIKYANMSVVYASIVHLFGLILLAMSNNITIYNVAIMVIVTQSVDLSYRIFGVTKNKLFARRRT